jgi:hypothetical protein
VSHIFALVILKMGSHKLFAKDGLKWRYSTLSVSQVVRITGESHQCLSVLFS